MARTKKYNVDTPGAIIAAAGPMFAERGFAAVTLKDIVKVARVNSAAVNYHFGDKHGLYRAVIEHNLKEREQSAPIDTPDKKRLPPEERLRDFIHTLMIQLLDERLPSVMSRLMLREAIDPTAVFDRAVEELPQRQLKMLDAMIGHLAGGHVGKADIRRMSVSVLGQCVYYRYAHKFLRKIGPRMRYTPRMIGTLADHIYRFSLGGIRILSGPDRNGSTTQRSPRRHARTK